MLTAVLTGIVRRFGLQGERLGEVAAGAVLKHTRDFNLTRDAALSSGLAPQTPAYDVQQACATSLETAILVGKQDRHGPDRGRHCRRCRLCFGRSIAISERLRRLVLGLNRAKSASARLALLAQLRPSMLLPSVPNVNERRKPACRWANTANRWCGVGTSVGKPRTNWHCRVTPRVWPRSTGVFLQGFGDSLRGAHTRQQPARRYLARKAREAAAGVSIAAPGHGTLTAGNSTPLTDGAAAILLASEKWAGAHGQAPQAWLVDAETAAVDYFGPDPKVCSWPRCTQCRACSIGTASRFRISISMKIHEAFSGQVLCTLAAWEDEGYCAERWGAQRRSVPSINRASM